MAEIQYRARDHGIYNRAIDDLSGRKWQDRNLLHTTRDSQMNALGWEYPQRVKVELRRRNRRQSIYPQKRNGSKQPKFKCFRLSSKSLISFCRLCFTRSNMTI